MYLFRFVLFLLSLVMLWRSDSHLEGLSTAMRERVQGSEALYLPSLESVKVSSLGYKNVFAHILWFSTLNYFGKHHASDQNYEWLFHRCQLVTRLAPERRHVWKFCALMLAWEQKQPELGLRMLNGAVAQYPHEWEFFYYRGFVQFFFLDNNEEGKRDLIEAAKKPGVPKTVARLATKKVLESEDKAFANAMVEEMLDSIEDPLIKRTIRERQRELEQ